MFNMNLEGVVVKIIYDNIIKNVGPQAEVISEEKMFILFGDNAPDLLKDFCYTIDVKNLNGNIYRGSILEVDGKEYKITAVGNIAEKNLVDLGHVTFMFDGSKEASLPGTIYVEKSEVPKLHVGSTILIKNQVTS